MDNSKHVKEAVLTGRWEVVSLAGTHGSRLEKYDNRDVVIVSTGKAPRIYLTPAVWTKLGEPDGIVVLKRPHSSNIGFTNRIGLPGNPYLKVMAIENTAKTRTTYQLAAQTIMKRYAPDLKSGVYDVIFDGGIAVFDTAQAPSRP